jgi:hypothetical protein
MMLVCKPRPLYDTDLGAAISQGLLVKVASSAAGRSCPPNLSLSKISSPYEDSDASPLVSSVGVGRSPSPLALALGSAQDPRTLGGHHTQLYCRDSVLQKLARFYWVGDSELAQGSLRPGSIINL